MKRPVFILITAVMVLLIGIQTAGCGKAGAPEKAEPEKGEAAEEIQEEEPAADNKDKEDDIKEERKVNTDNIRINTQSSIRIEGSKTVYIDPYKIQGAPHDADLILITHAHYDHFDPPSIKNVAGDKTMIVCPDSMSGDVKSLTIGTDTAFMEPGAKISPESYLEGITIEAVPAYNLNKSFHPKANGWLGYVLTMDGVKYYAAGDTDALPELEDVKCDIAFVPIGGTYTMTAKEAAGLVNGIKPEIAVPIHYGTIVGRPGDADTFGAAISEGIKMVKKVEDAK